MSPFPKTISEYRLPSFKLSVAILFGLHLVALSLFAVYRFVDWDEGFYLQAGRSVASGLRLYSDFFYPQAPLYPHFLALLPGSGWDYWLQARFTSVLFSVLTMALVGLSIRRIVALKSVRTESGAQMHGVESYTPILLGLALYSISGMFLAWNSIAKPLALSQLLLLAGMFARLMAQDRDAVRSAFWLFVSGVSLALAIQTRSPLLVAWIITLLSAFTGISWKQKALNVALFLTGSHLAAFPSIRMALRDSSRFFFDNFGFHLTRTDPPSLTDLLSDKINFLTRAGLDPQITIVLFLAVIILLNMRHLRSMKGALRAIQFYPLAVGALIIGAYFLAFPAHRHYVVQGLPALMVFVAAHSDTLLQALRKAKGRVRKSAPTAIATIYALGVIPYVWIYFTASRARDQRCERSRVAEIVSVIKRRSTPTDTILAELPIYAVLADRIQAPRAEFVGFEYKSLALGKQYGSMNLADSAYIADFVTSQKAQLVVVENFPDAGLTEALKGNYQKAYEDSFSQVWEVESR